MEGNSPLTKAKLSVVDGDQQETSKPLSEHEKVLFVFLVDKLTETQQEAARLQAALQQRNADLQQFILKAAETHGADPQVHVFNQDLLQFEPKPAAAAVEG